MNVISVATFIFNFFLLFFFQKTNLATDSLIYFIAIVIQTIAIILDTVLARHKFKVIRLQILCGYIARLIVLFVDIYGKKYITIPQSGADSVMFYNRAVIIMNGGTSSRGGYFSLVMGYIFKFIGSNQIYAQFIMIMISMACIYLIARILIDLKIDPKTLSENMWIICLFPTFTMLSAIFLREVIVALFVTISLFCFIRYMLNGNILYILISFSAVLLGAIFHSGIISLYGGYIIVLIFYNNKNKSYNFNVIGVVFAVVFGLLFLFIIASQSDTFLQKFSGVDNIEDISNDNDTAGSSYAQFVGSSKNPLSMIIFTLPRMFFFLFSPVPFQWRSPVDAITFFCSSMIYMISIYYAIQTIRFSENKLYKSIVIALLIVAACTVFVFGWGVSNAGTALRHRDKIFAIFAIMLTVGRSAWINTDHYKLKKAEK